MASSQSLARSRSSWARCEKLVSRRELIEKLKSLVLKDELSPGERLPSERQLAELLSVSRPSLRQALPNTIAFARGATGKSLADQDYLDFANELIPAHGAVILAAWKAIGGKNPLAMRMVALKLGGALETEARDRQTRRPAGWVSATLPGRLEATRASAALSGRLPRRLKNGRGRMGTRTTGVSPACNRRCAN
jgi:hypothetical protein